jgi:hypothetical protein
MTVLRRTWRYSRTPSNRGATFAIPDVAPGQYLVALYDGGEGGAHYSWDTLTVLREDERVTGRATGTPPSGGVAVPTFVGAVLAAGCAGLIGGAALRRFRRRTPPA